MTKPNIYLDYAATTPVDPEIWDIFSEATKTYWANPSGSHSMAQGVRAVLDTARNSIAQTFGLTQKDKYKFKIIFTSSATEANNLAIQGYLKSILAKNPSQKPHILLNPTEHESVLESFKSFKDKIDIEFLDIDKFGQVLLKNIPDQIRPSTCLVSVMFANNEIGTIQPVSEIGTLIQDINADRQKNGLNKIAFQIDAVQAPCFLKIDLIDLKCHLLTVSGHKMYSVKGAACLCVSSEVEIQPVNFGGGQEYGLRSGTENVAAVVAMAKALEKAQSQSIDFSSKMSDLNLYLSQKLEQELALLSYKYVLNGHPKNRLANNLNFSFFEIDHQELLVLLDLAGVCLSGGSSCASGSNKMSHVIKTLHPDWQADKIATIRVSFGRGNTTNELDKFIQVLVRSLGQLKKDFI
jgi:cysteine desulfurase